MRSAQELGRLSLDYVSQGNRQAWLALFAEDAVLHDPYGCSPFDPEGKGYHGKQAIAAFWDAVIAGNTISGRVRESYPAGDSCANVITTVTARPGQPPLEVSNVTVYRANSAGEISHFTAYWSLD
jgi:steroid Delta-isomerase